MSLKNKLGIKNSSKLVSELHVSELILLIDERIGAAFKKHLKSNLKNDLLTRTDLTQIFKISLVTVYKWTQKGLLKPIKISSRIYYRKTDIEKIMQYDELK